MKSKEAIKELLAILNEAIKRKDKGRILIIMDQLRIVNWGTIEGDIFKVYDQLADQAEEILKK